ncbi:carboxylesterase family protein [Mucilaginibacter terrae]|nr:prolyl oligopeptidase family serine peptidase [Mucilaginibacter terrae]
MKKNLLLILTFVALVCTNAKAQQFAKYKKEVYQHKGDTLLYRILLPQNFDPTKKYPLLFVLHGSGERGNDNEAQLRNGGKVFLNDAFRKQHQAIVIFPQCPKESYWANAITKRDPKTNTLLSVEFTTNKKPTQAMHALEGFVKHFLKNDYVDKDRVYVGGLSMGGMGTFELLWRKPKVFAAAFAICGGAHLETAKKYAKRVPMWIFHGVKDDVVLPKYSEQMVQAIKQYGGNPKFTLYPNDNHNSWDSAFAEPELFNWLFNHKK